MTHDLPRSVQVIEVGPRDGLQNESGAVSTDEKVAFINRLSDAGCTHIEVTSFVSPKWVPALADHDAVFRRIEQKPGVVYSALVPNRLGMERARDAGVKHIAIFTAASERFTQKNINATVDESLARYTEVCGLANQENITIRGYISTSFGCPYEGAIDERKVRDVARVLLDLGVTELSLGDTIGVATPDQVQRVLDAVKEVATVDQIAVHFHDTHGRALANVLTALQHGVAAIDSSAGGLGGCPYATGASGNLATEDLVSWLSAMGIHTGIDLDTLSDASIFMERVLGHTLPSRHLQARRAGK